MARDDEIEKLLGSRPKTNRGGVRKHHDLGPLQDLLIEACPPDESGQRSIPLLAKALGMSSWGVFKWIKADKIPPGQALRIIELSEGRVTREQFDPFVYR